MPTARTFISYATDDAQRVVPLLEKASCYGVRPWMDVEDLRRHAGAPLSEMLDEAIGSEECKSLTFFVSEASLASGWVQHELRSVERWQEQGRRVIPVLLDPYHALIDHPDLKPPLNKTLQGLLTRDTRYLQAEDPKLLPHWAASVLHAAGLTHAEEVVLHLGHRESSWLARIPKPWSQYPVIDLRLGLRGKRNLKPTTEQWSRLYEGLRFLADELDGLRTLRFCGFAPLGVGALLGWTWDRGRNVCLRGWNRYGEHEWVYEGLHDGDWSPGSSPHVQLIEKAGEVSRDRPVVVAMMNHNHHLTGFRDWLERNGRAEDPRLVVSYPSKIDSPQMAADVARDLANVFQYARSLHPHSPSLDWFSAVPLMLTPLIAAPLRALGRIRFFDQSSTDPLDYGLAGEAIT